jgi:YidC/Oxa1 family membrane protein insertase
MNEQQQKPLPSGMIGRYVIFIVASMAIIGANAYINAKFFPPEKPAPAVAQKANDAKDAKKETAKGDNKPATKEQKPADAKSAPGDLATAEKTATENKRPEEVKKPEDEKPIAQKWVALGSVDPASPYRMLVTLDSKGAAVERIEFSSPRYRDLDDRHGYLGHVLLGAPDGGGARVDVVGPGTPAARAGVQVGDVIVRLGEHGVLGPESLADALAATKPGDSVELTVRRNDKLLSLTATLGWRPLEVIRPEGSDPLGQRDPLSFLVTLAQIDDHVLPKPELASPEKAAEEKYDAQKAKPRPDLDRELAGVRLREANWELVESTATKVVFSRVLKPWDLEVRKVYELARRSEGDAASQSPGEGYHLTLRVEIVNRGKEKHKVSYALDGPTGLPVEGYWYANKVSRGWGMAGIRDVAVSIRGNTPSLITATSIADGTWGKLTTNWVDPIHYVGVDAQYFSVVMLPQQAEGEDWIAEGWPMRVGAVDAVWHNKVNTSFRLVSEPHELAPGAQISQSYRVFAGPKVPDVLAHYGLDELVYYGWFSPVAKVLIHLLHFFYGVVGNLGVAIIMLTVVVRLSIFPLSRKQALSAQKMQTLQPEMKRIQEQYKNDLEARGRAMQELYAKHNFNPLGGCLLAFIQLPILMGLYRALMVDVEMRQTPLLSESIRWASNLAGPDMLFNWSEYVPAFVSSGYGTFGLGPYFNILPLLTVALFIWQQKKLMPPAVDEQQQVQQNMMMYMTVFMGVLFYKVAAGLCVYFIASSLWGLAERKFLPKTTPPAGQSAVTQTPPQVTPTKEDEAKRRNGEATSSARRKNRKK